MVNGVYKRTRLNLKLIPQNMSFGSHWTDKWNDLSEDLFDYVEEKHPQYSSQVSVL